MNNLSRVFAFDECMVRVVGEPGVPMFVAADLCRALGIQNVTQAVADFPKDEVGVCQAYTNYALGEQEITREQQVATVTEPGLYRLIFRSDKPEAERFRRWVFHEVLPEIRRTGRFNLSGESEQMWVAFEKAKTGKVQMALLAAMGISAAESGPVRPVRPVGVEPPLGPGRYETLHRAHRLIQRLPRQPRPPLRAPQRKIIPPLRHRRPG